MQNTNNGDQLQQRARDEIDRCELEITRKQRLISEKQKFIEVLQKELVELKKHKGSLEFVMTGTRPIHEPANDENQERLPFPGRPQSRYNNTTNLSLKGSVAQILHNDTSGGLSIGEIMEKLKAKGFDSTTSNFYQVVYSACVRLATDQNTVIRRKEVEKGGEKGLLFFAEKNPA